MLKNETRSGKSDGQCFLSGVPLHFRNGRLRLSVPTLGLSATARRMPDHGREGASGRHANRNCGRVGRCGQRAWPPVGRLFQCRVCRIAWHAVAACCLASLACKDGKRRRRIGCSKPWLKDQGGDQPKADPYSWGLNATESPLMPKKGDTPKMRRPSCQTIPNLPGSPHAGNGRKQVLPVPRCVR